MPPVLVLGTGITALGVLRICHRAGIPSYCMAESHGFDRYSRWYRPAPARTGRNPHRLPLPDFLSDCTLPTAVLMPCTDVWTRQTADLPSDLARRFPSSIARSEAIHALVDKSEFALLLARTAVPHPVTRILSGPGDLADLPDRVLQDAFLKPHDSHDFFSRFGVKAFHIESRAQAVAALSKVEQAGLRVLVQEYIPGPGSLHYFVDGFVDAGGRLRAVFTRRRLRMHPPDFGNSSYMTSVPHEEVAPAIDSVRIVLRELGYRGIFSAEFKRDPRDRLFKLLEINARPWWYIEFAARSGVDVCSMAYRDALGRPVDEVATQQVGTRLVYPYYDYFSCRAAQRAGELTAWEWARSWIGAQQPLFNWTDPKPAWIEYWRVFRARVDRLLRRDRPR